MEGAFQMSTSGASRDPRSRADAVRNRQRVLDATKALLGETGVGVTVEAISREAGVGAATVVRTFGGKEALLDAAVADLLGPIVQRARDALSEPDSSQALRGFLIELIAFQHAHYVTGEQLHGLDVPLTTAKRAELEKAVTDLISRARDDGAIRTDIDPAVTTILIGEATHAIARSKSASRALSEDYVKVVMDGLRPPTGPL
jgi:AcrR family transcriptional regulator